jgi:hypothetical protein
MTSPSSSPARGRGYRLVTRTLVTAATAAAFVGLASVSASAAPVNVLDGSVQANVEVGSTLTLALDQDDFLLSGFPTDVVVGLAAVTGSVTTNNASGYSVGVQAAEATLDPPTGTNTDTIPIAALQVTNEDNAYTSLSSTAPVTTTTKDTRSELDGDAFSDDYRVTIPDVNTDTYSVTLNYTATALA